MLRFITFKIEGDSEIVIDQKGPRENTYEDFIVALKNEPAGEPRYGVVDCDYTTEDGRDASKICFVAYVPDTCKIKMKMLYSGACCQPLHNRRRPACLCCCCNAAMPPPLRRSAAGASPLACSARRNRPAQPR